MKVGLYENPLDFAVSYINDGQRNKAVRSWVRNNCGHALHSDRQLSFSFMPVMDLLLPAIKGFGIGAGFIIAIGAQNGFVLSCGIRRQNILAVSSIGFFGDAFLILLGVAGLGHLIAETPWLTSLTAWGGAVFLFIYGGNAFRRAANPSVLAQDDRSETNTLWRDVLTMLAVTFLNPHVYLDTVVLLGALAGQYPPAQRAAFGFGAASVSAVWFYGLGYGARFLAPLFVNPTSWRILDIIIGIVMWTIAAGLLLGELG